MPEICCAKLNLLEPSNKHVNQGLLIARTLIDSSHDQMTISLLNASDKNIKLRESTTLGVAHPVKTFLTIQRSLDSIRSLNVMQSLTVIQSLSAIQSLSVVQNLRTAQSLEILTYWNF